MKKLTSGLVLSAFMLLTAACGSEQTGREPLHDSPAPMEGISEPGEAKTLRDRLLENPILPLSSDEVQQLEDHLVAYYTFDTLGEDGRIADLSGNGLHLAVAAGADGKGADLVDSPRGRALRVSGDDKATVPAAALAKQLGPGDFTIATWVRIDPESAHRGTIFGWVGRRPALTAVTLRIHQRQSATGVMFNLQSNRVHAETGDGNNAIVEMLPAPVYEQGVYVLVAGRRVRGGTTTLYFDGRLVAQDADDGFDLSSADAVMGVCELHAFAGAVDEVRVWDMALSEREIMSLPDALEPAHGP